MGHGFLTSIRLAALATVSGVLPAVHVHAAEAGLWQQCGGFGYTGPTTCVSGGVCVRGNDWYWQCFAKPSPSPDVKYLITFGDSYSATGFDISSTKPGPGNPIGNPAFPGSTTSGGVNWVGSSATEFNKSLVLSYNFARAGATTNNSIVLPWKPPVPSLVDQVAEFSGSIASKPSYAPWTAENALFGVFIGINDIGGASGRSDFDQVLEQIMNSYFGQLQVLYNAGGRNFLLLSIPPIYRSPQVLNYTQDAQQNTRTAVTKYNNAIATRLADFTARNSGVAAQLVDTTGPFNTALDNPTGYGATDNLCTGWTPSCLWADPYHPGVAIHRLVAGAVTGALKGKGWFVA